MISWTIAKQECKLALRSRWLFAMGLLFALFSGIVLFFGSTEEVEGYVGFSRQTASLLNLSLFLMPLITLLVGSILLAGEKEDGQFTLYMTYPISIRSVLLGKYIGIALPLLFILSIGYGIVVAFLWLLRDVQWTFIILYYSVSALLLLMFLSIAILVGAVVKNRLHAVGIGLFLWAFFVLFYEMIVIALSFFVPPQQVLGLLTISVFFNPVELIRVFTVLFLGSGTIFGPSMYDFTIWASRTVGKVLFLFACLLWIGIPLVLTYLLMRKRRT